MKELVIISGKGGTGKTSIVSSFAMLASDSELFNPIFVDCDVDAADLHLILEPEVLEKNDFYSGKLAIINKEKCIKCNKCKELCKFDAIENNLISKIKCEGCAVCAEFCPQKAITLNEKLAGEWYISQTRFGKFIHAKLGIAEENSGKLVTKIRNQARLTAQAENSNLIISDGSPGIGCPVIASISGVNAVLIITEPTVSGLHDLQRVYKLTRHFKINSYVCINKFDINLEISKQIKDFCTQNNTKLLGKIPYDKDFTSAQVSKKSITEHSNNNSSKELKKLWNDLEIILKGD